MVMQEGGELLWYAESSDMAAGKRGDQEPHSRTLRIALYTKYVSRVSEAKLCFRNIFPHGQGHLNTRSLPFQEQITPEAPINGSAEPTRTSGISSKQDN